MCHISEKKNKIIKNCKNILYFFNIKIIVKTFFEIYFQFIDI